VTANEDCIFCRIASGGIPSYRVAEAERAVAFLDLNPASEGHTLVIPREHSADIWDLPADDGLRKAWESRPADPDHLAATAERLHSR
jgi:diadenosine tetraphosphate (Ap4A) HIT family hydrolase